MRVLRAGSSAAATSPVDADDAPTWTASITAASITATVTCPGAAATASKAASKAACAHTIPIEAPPRALANGSDANEQSVGSEHHAGWRVAVRRLPRGAGGW